MSESSVALRGMSWTRSNLDNGLLTGAEAGLFAGVVMGISATIYAAIIGMGATLPWESVAGTFYGPMAYVGGAGVTILGMLTHLVMAMILGVVFAFAARNLRKSFTGLWVGICYGTCVWAVMTWVILPILDQTMAARVALIPAWWFALHWIYGGILGLTLPPMMRRTFHLQSAP